MGQYYKGRKIGTCESMYYMHLDEAEKLAKLGAADDDGITFQRYLTDNVTRFRFPFPGEEAKTEFEKYDKSFSLPVGGVEVNHDKITVHNTLKSGGYGINISIPCPHSEEFKKSGIETSRGGAGEQFVEVLFEGYRKHPETGEVKKKTIFACSRCGQQQWFEDEDIVKIKERAKEYYKVYEKNSPATFEYAMKIIERIS